MSTPARRKPRRSRKQRRKLRKLIPVVTIPRPQKVDFPEVKGKTLEGLRLSLDSDDSGISLSFQDKTYLEFSIEPLYTVRTEYSNWKTGGWRKIKRWPVFQSKSAWVKWL
jgi:hypothetical protein